MRHLYYGYHEIIESEIEFPELLPAPETLSPTVTIGYEEPSEFLLQRKADGLRNYLSQELVWVRHVIGVHMMIKNGRDIRVKLDQEVEPEIVRAMILGTCFAALFTQRGLIPLHGGTITKDGIGGIVSGKSGAGKSTTTYELLEQGATFVVDDVSIAELLEGEIHIREGYPQQKLCRDIIEAKGLEGEHVVYINELRDKFARRLESGYEKEPVPVRYFFVLEIDDTLEEVTVEEVLGGDRIFIIRENLFRQKIYDELNQGPAGFKKILDLAANLHIYRIKRPIIGAYGETMAGKILELMQNP